MKKTLIALAFLFPFLFACAESPTDPMVPPVAEDTWDGQDEDFYITDVSLVRVYQNAVKVRITATGHIMTARAEVDSQLNGAHGIAECSSRGTVAECMVPMEPHACTVQNMLSEEYVAFIIVAEAAGTQGNWYYGRNITWVVDGGYCPPLIVT